MVAGHVAADFRRVDAAEAYYEFLLGTHLEAEAASTRRSRRSNVRRARPARRQSFPPNWRRSTPGRAISPGPRSLAEAALTIDDDNVEAHRVLGSVFAVAGRPRGGTAPRARRHEPHALAIDHLERGRRPTATDRTPGIDITLARLYMRLDDNPKSRARAAAVADDEPDLP